VREQLKVEVISAVEIPAMSPEVRKALRAPDVGRGASLPSYNREHRHGAIRYVTPEERHFGREKEILSRRQRLYEWARQNNPERWTGATRNWSPVRDLTLNPAGVSEVANT
jgi:hypothetical protein